MSPGMEDMKKEISYDCEADQLTKASASIFFQPVCFEPSALRILNYDSCPLFSHYIAEKTFYVLRACSGSQGMRRQRHEGDTRTHLRAFFLRFVCRFSPRTDEAATAYSLEQKGHFGRSICSKAADEACMGSESDAVKRVGAPSSSALCLSSSATPSLRREIRALSWPPHKRSRNNNLRECSRNYEPPLLLFRRLDEGSGRSELFELAALEDCSRAGEEPSWTGLVPPFNPGFVWWISGGYGARLRLNSPHRHLEP